MKADHQRRIVLENCKWKVGYSSAACY